MRNKKNSRKPRLPARETIKFTDSMDVTVIRSDRTTVSLEITPDCQVRVRAPLLMTADEIQRFLKAKDNWIRKHLAVQEERKARWAQGEQKPLTAEELQQLADQAVDVLPKRAAYFAQRMGVTYGRITIRNQKTKWGSCSSQGNLNFNCLLMLAPPEVQDYVVVHELCHRKEMNHSARFWAEVEQVLPDYRQQVKWLKENGGGIMQRMTG